MSVATVGSAAEEDASFSAGSSAQVSSILASPNKSFDKRLSSHLSQINNKSPLRNTSSGNFTLLSELNSHFTTDDDLSNAASQSPSTIQWSKLNKISQQIYSSTAVSENGSPLLFAVSEEYIAIATSRNLVLLFSYSQVLLLKVRSDNLESDAIISAISLSVDSTYLAVGYSNGHINLWDLKKADPVISLPPVTLKELQFNGSHYHIAHFQGMPIANIEFVGTRHTSFISSDESGMLILHNASRTLTGFFTRSKILYGDFKIDAVLKQTSSDKNTMLDFKLLPIGSKRVFTDEMQLLGYITPSTLTVISTKPEIKTEFTIKNRHSLSGREIFSLISWFPAVKDNSSSDSNSPLLAFCWSNFLFMSEIDVKKQDDGDSTQQLQTPKSISIELDEEISHIEFLSKDIIIALTVSNKMHLIRTKTLKILKTLDLEGKNLINTKQRKQISDINASRFNGSFAIFKSNIFILQRDLISFGTLTNWADILLNFLNKGQYMVALFESKRQYQGDEDLPLLSLPEDDVERHLLMRDYMIQIFKSSMKYLLNDPQLDVHEVKQVLLLGMQLCLLIKADYDLYDLMFEQLSERGYEQPFFEILRTFILDLKITAISPTIMKAMIQYYFKNKEVEDLEQLICLLDIRQLDIDLTFSLCKEFHLNEISTYIWTVLLNDYITPMATVIGRMKDLNEKRLNLTDEEVAVLQTDINYIYPYISYILTGRQFPSERCIPDEFITSAKLNIYFFLFHGSVIEWPPGAGILKTRPEREIESAFPYLVQFLKYDSESMISCINEAFEDELLNDNNEEISSVNEDAYQMKVNRQFILDVLLGIYNDLENNFTFHDKVIFAIFISRNYPKYSQFIRIADSLADEIIDTLCKAGCMYSSNSNTDTITEELYQDCQLGLQALLSIYKPIDTESVILEVEKAGFYQVLLSLYQTDGRFIDTLKLWVKFKKDKNFGLKIDLVKSVPEIISYILKESSNNEIRDLYKLIHEELETFVSADPTEIAIIVCNFFPELNTDVTKFKDSHLKFDYLKAVFNVQSKGGKLNKTVGRTLKLEYLKGLVNQKKIVNDSITNAFRDANYISEANSSLQALTEKIEFFVNTLDELDDTALKLLSNEYEIIVKWYLAHDDIQKAIDLLCTKLKEDTMFMLNEGYDSEIEKRIWNHLSLAFSILRSTKSVLYMKEDGMTLKERMMLQIVETCVGLFTEINDMDSQNEELANLQKKVVQMAFTQIMNLNKESPKSFSNVFNNFLDGSSAQMTTLGDARLILKEIFISYTNNERVLNLIRGLVDEDIFMKLAELEELKIVGRSSLNLDCETCGKRVWGSKVGNQVYDLWRDYKLNTEVDPELTRKNELIIFKCHHSFHRKCIENMGMSNDEEKRCIICSKD